MEPRLIGIILPFQIVGPDITHLETTVVDQPEIDKPAELLLHDAKDAVQVAFAGKFFEGVGGGDETHRGEPLS